MIIFSSNCAVFTRKKLRYIKKQEVEVLLSMIGKNQLIDPPLP